MTGPVWRRREGETTTCDECLREVDCAYVEGIVRDNDFEDRRVLCEECYRTKIALIARSH
jgi:hypothetical protein